MIPSRERSHKEQVFQPKNSGAINLLRGAVIYGSNASGKSNLIQAIAFARNLIIKGRRAKHPINTRFFKLDNESWGSPSRFEFEIQVQNKMYAYGFECNQNSIQEEWLYLVKRRGDDVLIFERKKVYDKDGGRLQFSFGDIMKLSEKKRQYLEFVAEGTRSNQLFLTESIDRNVEYFADIYKWFSDTLKIITPHSIFDGIEFKIHHDEKFKEYLSGFLDSADTGINSVATEKKPLKSVSGVPQEVITQLDDSMADNTAIILQADTGKRVVCRKQGGELEAFKLSTVHRCDDGNDIPFSLEEESDGTKRLIDLSPAAYDMAYSQESRVYIIDEIDRSLHPHLSRMLLQVHLEAEHKESQLIVSTHETSLLDVSLVRRDEIWFIQKDETGASKLYSLNDFNPRYDKDIRKDYLLGRYGAIPFIGDIRKLSR